MSGSGGVMDDPALVEALLRATTAAAAATLPLVGSGDGDAVDGAAVAAMRFALTDAPCDGRVVIGEGEKDEAPMLALGERFGTGEGPAIDLAVDPVDGTRLAAAGRPGAMAVASIAPRGAFCDLGPAHYLEKLVSWHPAAALDRPLSELITAIARERGVPAGAVRVAVQDRPRNAGYAAAARAAGAEVVPFEHGDVERSLRAAQRGTDLDVLVGIGGAPEGVLVSAAVRALGGAMQARPAPQSDAERRRVLDAGVDLDRVLTLDGLCSGPALCVLSAVTEVDPGGAVRLTGAARVDEGVAVESWVVASGHAMWIDRRVVTDGFAAS
ncbi:fructose-bisphosphatase class II family protein [Agromyces intestinalis]|uniref:Fructose-1,6-bisphosphatase n=1 Tax=Agromyces intestinalis TaxID=2592652 RepID=A0A5C1YH28_9MICO|nr:fructose-bisphosphatase class II [Agromyces intestinalis]QEO15484.1 fructose-bisphosphatase class II family protein [Agromyces intestinalis]